MSKLIKRVSADFTIISNKVFRNRKLSVTDRGTLCTLLSLPDNWNFSIRGLVAILPDGVTKIENSLHRLEHKHHYLKRVRVYENGKIVDWDYLISDEPMEPDEEDPDSSEETVENSDISSFFAQQDTDFEHTENLDTENPDIEKPHLENQYAYKILNNQERKNKILDDKESIHQSAAESAVSTVETVESVSDGVSEGYITDRKRIRELLKKHIEYSDYIKWIQIFGRDRSVKETDELVSKLVKAATCGHGRVIQKESFTKEEVQEAVLNLNRECIDKAYEVLRQKTPQEIVHKTSYLVSVLIQLGSEYDLETNIENRSTDYDVKYNILGYGFGE